MTGISGERTIPIGNVLTPYNSPMLGLEMGDPLSKIYTKHPGWKDVIRLLRSQPGSILKHYD